MINEIKVEGEICGDQPELKSFPSGDLFLKFSIQWKGNERGRELRSFFKVVLYGKMAEEFNSLGHWKKGRRLIITGYLNSWRSKEGKTYYEVVCKKMQISGGGQPTPAQAPAPKAQPAYVPEVAADEFAVDDEVPSQVVDDDGVPIPF